MLLEYSNNRIKVSTPNNCVSPIKRVYGEDLQTKIRVDRLDRWY